MPHISRQFLKGDAEKKLIEALINTLAVKGSNVRRSKICWELLTGVERLMLAKRLAIICLLARNVPFDAIAEKLMVSSSTVSRLHTRIQAGMYKETIKAAQANNVDELVLKFLATVLLGPRQRTQPRWKWLEEF